MEYLGFWVKRDVLKPINKKIKAIKNMKPPTVGKQLFTTFGKSDLINDNWRTTYARQTT